MDQGGHAVACSCTGRFWIAFGSSFFWLAHMIIGTLGDYFTRKPSFIG